jgi:hypothetical protein
MFDPYRKWLGIPEDKRPPTHYQMLGISPDERDPDVIEAAVVRQSAYVRNFQAGQFGEHAARILTEIAAARHCLLDPTRRAQYDAELQAKLKPQRPVIDDEPRLLDLDAPNSAATKPPPRRPPPPASHSSGHLSGVMPDDPLSEISDETPDGGVRSPARPRAAPAGTPLPSVVDLEQIAPLAPRGRAAARQRVGGGRRAQRTAVARPQSLVGLVWQLPLLLVMLFALIASANALGRAIARSRARSAAPPAADQSTVLREALLRKIA